MSFIPQASVNLLVQNFAFLRPSLILLPITRFKTLKPGGFFKLLSACATNLFCDFFWIVKEHHLLKFMFEREEPEVSRTWTGRGEERERKKGFRQGDNIKGITYKMSFMLKLLRHSERVQFVWSEFYFGFPPVKLAKYHAQKV